MYFSQLHVAKRSKVFQLSTQIRLVAVIGMVSNISRHFKTDPLDALRPMTLNDLEDHLLKLLQAFSLKASYRFEVVDKFISFLRTVRTHRNELGHDDSTTNTERRRPVVVSLVPGPASAAHVSPRRAVSTIHRPVRRAAGVRTGPGPILRIFE